MLIRRWNWGEDRVYFHDDAGQLVSVPANYTDVDASDPFVAIAAGRSLFRYEDLLNLVRLIHHVDESGKD